MACGALDETNIAEVLARTGADELHFAAPKVLPSGMAFRNPDVGMGGTDIEREYRADAHRPRRRAPHHRRGARLARRAPPSVARRRPSPRAVRAATAPRPRRRRG